MAIHDIPFSHNTIANTTIAVGAIFDNLKITRTDSQSNTTTIAVPLKYQRKEYWYQKLVDNQKESSVTFQQSMPRIMYNLKSVARDTTKVVNRQNKLSVTDQDVNGTRKWTFVPVPYDLFYEVNIVTKYYQEGAQILEQILPYFNPTINMKVTEVNAINAVNDVQVSLSGDPELEDNILDGLIEATYVVWTIQVKASTNFYQEVKEQKVIRHVIVDIDNYNTMTDLETIYVDAVDGEYEDKENSTITIEIGV